MSVEICSQSLNRFSCIIPWERDFSRRLLYKHPLDYERKHTSPSFAPLAGLCDPTSLAELSRPTDAGSVAAETFFFPANFLTTLGEDCAAAGLGVSGAVFSI